MSYQDIRERFRKSSQPVASDLHIDQALTNISIAYHNAARNFVASQVFPSVAVQHQSDKYFIFNKNDWLRDEARIRADSTESAGSGFGVSQAAFYADVYAFHKDVGDQARANADPFSLMEAATQFVAQKMLLRQEIQWATDYFGTGIWGTDTTVTTQWSNYTTSDPIADVNAAKRVVLSTTGYEPNTLVVGYDVDMIIKNHPDMIDRIKYGGGMMVSDDVIAQIFGVDRYLVCRAIKATNIEGETAVYSFIHGKHALVAYVNPNPGLLEPSAGYRFTWDAVSDGTGAAIGTVQFRIEEKRTTRVESQMAFDFKAVATDMAVFLPNVVA